MISDLEIILRLVLAGVVGGVIGYQREKAEKPAGLRTHILVCLGSCLIMLVSVYPFLGLRNVDPTRIAAQVVTGIGFLGAGAIIRQGSVVRGLTTAASLWVVAALGLAIGAGFYVGGLAAMVLVIVSLVVLKSIEARTSPEFESLTVRVSDEPGKLGRIGEVLGQMGVDIKHIEVDNIPFGEVQINLTVSVPATVEPRDVVENLSRIEGMRRVTWGTA